MVEGKNVTPITAGKSGFSTRARVPRGESDLISFRCATKSIRQMDEIVATRDEPDLRTRSDILQTAVIEWIDRYYESHPNGRGKASWTLQMVALRRERRDLELDHAVREASRARNEEDQSFLQMLLPHSVKMKKWFEEEKASPTEMKAVEALIGDVRDALRSLERKTR